MAESSSLLLGRPNRITPSLCVLEPMTNQAFLKYSYVKLNMTPPNRDLRQPEMMLTNT